MKMNNERETLLKQIENNTERLNQAFKNIRGILTQFYGENIISADGSMAYHFDAKEYENNTIEELREKAKEPKFLKIKEKQYEIIKRGNRILTAEIRFKQLAVAQALKFLDRTYKEAEKSVEGKNKKGE